MQHYGFPTRILDISKNPLAALFFACFSEAGKDEYAKDDGIVYVYAVPRQEIAFCDSDRVTILANLCIMPNDFSITGLDMMSEKHLTKTIKSKTSCTLSMMTNRVFCQSSIKRISIRQSVCARA
jgi:hypothetical protein